jgi:hypothetical protein
LTGGLKQETSMDNFTNTQSRPFCIFYFPTAHLFNFLKPTAQMAHLQNRTSPTLSPSFAKEPFFANAPGNIDNFVH